MKKAAGILGAMLAGVSLLTWVASSAAGASAGSQKWRLNGGAAPTTAAPQPGRIALLGAGLIVLGIYAKRKNGKKT